MRCKSSQFLLISILTFAVGIVIVQVWQSYYQTNIEDLAFQQDLTKNLVSNSFTKQTHFMSCEEVKNRNGGKASLNRTVNAGVLNGKSCMVEPIYSQIAISKGIEGKVNVEVFADGFGNVKSAKVASGHPLLRKSAIEAAYKTKVMSHWIGGEPVSIRGTLIYTFVLPTP